MHKRKKFTQAGEADMLSEYGKVITAQQHSY